MSKKNKIGILDPEGKSLNPLNGEEYSETYKSIAKVWSKFPAYELRESILDTIEKNQVTLVISGTGSGKTVLLPKYLLHVLEYKGKVGITLPKQIIAKSAAEFAAKTLDVKLGKQVGYQYKGSEASGKSKDTQLLYATDGTIVARLLKDPELKEFDGIIIDEAHERKVQIDFLLYLLKRTVMSRPDFKLVIMSATINEKIFEDYFNECSFGKVNVGAKTNYEITSHFLDKPIDVKEFVNKGFEIIKKIIDDEKKSKEKGDILFFVTSTNEADELCKKINAENIDGFCIEVYSGMNADKQELAQDKELYKSHTKKSRKIVIATNVAESSLTIDGIKYVIDSGLELTSYFDPKKRAKVLEKRLITHAQARQRMGRTGRTEPGTCYHLYTKNDFEEKMEKFPEPSIKTNNIYDECLKLLALPEIKTVGKLTEMLNEMIEPPKKQYVKTAITMLEELNLIDEMGEITPLGEQVVALQFDPMIGVAVMYGKMYGCAKEICAIFALVDASKGNTSELFIQPTNILSTVASENESGTVDDKYVKKINEKFQQAQSKISHKYGDHLSYLKIYTKYRDITQKYMKDKEKQHEEINEFCYDYFIKRPTLEKAEKYYKKMRQQVQQQFVDFNKMRIENDIDVSKYSLEDRVMYCICQGFKYSSGSLKPRDGTYYNAQNDELKINKNSLMMYKNDHRPKKVCYNSLFVNANMKTGTDMVFVSKFIE